MRIGLPTVTLDEETSIVPKTVVSGAATSSSVPVVITMSPRDLTAASKSRLPPVVTVIGPDELATASIIRSSVSSMLIEYGYGS